jgi:nucleoside-diphosphate-sugar epimerase
VAEAPDGGDVEIWGDGRQTRSFLYIDECIEGITRLMKSGFAGPVNLGSEEMVSIDALAGMIIACSSKRLHIRHVPGPVGVRGRTSDNELLQKHLGWRPTGRLAEGLRVTYSWVEQCVRRSRELGGQA